MMRSFVLISLLLAQLACVCGQCPLCFNEIPPPVTSDACDDLAAQASAITDANSNECIDVQTEGFNQCGCEPVAQPQDGDCTICGADPLPFPDRIIYLEGQDPLTCEELQELAEEDEAICSTIDTYKFYCGCPGVVPSCLFCPTRLTPRPDLVLTGLAPPDFPNPENWTCAEAERQRSILPDDQCDDLSTLPQAVQDSATLCGCFVPDEQVNCTAVCPDGTLVDPAFNENVLYDDVTCYDFQLETALGENDFTGCGSAFWAGIKYCGCNQTIPEICDLCEDGSKPTEHLRKFISFESGDVLSAAGWAYQFDPRSTLCTAWQGSFGEHAGCNNVIASNGACRLCDENGGDVVPIPNLTIDVSNAIVDCADLEFASAWDGNNLDCNPSKTLGIQCCPFAPSAAPTEFVEETLAPSANATEAPMTTAPTDGSGNPPATSGAAKMSGLLLVNAIAFLFLR